MNSGTDVARAVGSRIPAVSPRTSSLLVRLRGQLGAAAAASAAYGAAASEGARGVAVRPLRREEVRVVRLVPGADVADGRALRRAPARARRRSARRYARSADAAAGRPRSASVPRRQPGTLRAAHGGIPLMTIIPSQPPSFWRAASARSSSRMPAHGAHGGICRACSRR